MCNLLQKWVRTGLHLLAVTIFFLLVEIPNSGAAGRRMCYHCSSKWENATECAANPENLTDPGFRIWCEDSCIVKRVEFIHVNPAPFAIRRGCEKANATDEIIMDQHYVTYYRSCRRHLCNTGDALESFPQADNDTDVEDSANHSQDLTAQSMTRYGVAYTFWFILLRHRTFPNLLPLSS